MQLKHPAIQKGVKNLKNQLRLEKTNYTLKITVDPETHLL